MSPPPAELGPTGPATRFSRIAPTVRSTVRRFVPRRVRRVLRPSAPPWVITAPTPDPPRPLDDFGFYAIVGTWMEGDIIADTVANAFAQGVDRVFLADNDSPDDTVERAVAAGAECSLQYRTEHFEESYRYALMNELVHHVSSASPHDHVWWLWMDADEFCRPQGEGRLRDVLTHLDRSYRVVGARVLNHYPTPGETAHEPGTHPVEHQPLCEEVEQNICRAKHRKHPLQRWDRSGPDLFADFGFHRAVSIERPLLEPPTPIVMHHVPYRREEVSRARLDGLWHGRSDGESRAIEGDLATDHMQARLESIDAVYSGTWPKVRNFIPGRPEFGVSLVDWRELSPRIHPELPSWASEPHVVGDE